LITHADSEKSQGPASHIQAFPSIAKSLASRLTLLQHGVEPAPNHLPVLDGINECSGEQRHEFVMNIFLLSIKNKWDTV
jgi:hypothetical protein